MVVLDYNPSTWKVGVRGRWVQGQPHYKLRVLTPMGMIARTGDLALGKLREVGHIFEAGLHTVEFLKTKKVNEVLTLNKPLRLRPT